MPITRRDMLLGGGLAGAAALARPALAQSAPIRLGWLAALTGPGSSAGIGFDRGVNFAVNEINAAGGAKGRKIELVTRDTQGDPTKCVNASVEMAQRLKVDAVWGPCNSGEALACTPILARAHVPQIHPCFVDTLIDTTKYPNAYRIACSNQQLGEASSKYVLEIMKVREIAIIGDTTGYGTSTVQAYAPTIKQMGGNIVYQALIEASQADLSADVIRMRDAGAKVIMPWSVNGGLLARLLNARAELGWDVPVVGHPALGSGEVKALLAKPANWEKVYLMGFRSCSFDEGGKLPQRTQNFVQRISGKINLADTSLWWVACGYDVANLIAKAVAESGGASADDIIKAWNGLTKYPGIYGDYTYTAQQHNGYPTDEIVLSAANSFRDGAFALAPGYG
ncbi:MAG: ABC transporter substrate-binding protein [Acidisphaera sp.]|nr:ABC transporter substrate-binding protein [Acidisphaera sp.]